MDLAPGDIVGIPFRGVRHEGLVAIQGSEDTATVIHSSKRRGRVVEEPAAVFRAGRPISIVGRAVSPSASIAYARACIGRSWTYADNCQTFTREVAGTDHPSPDARRVGWTVAGLLVLAAVMRRTRAT